MLESLFIFCKSKYEYKDILMSEIFVSYGKHSLIKASLPYLTAGENKHLLIPFIFL
uniref:Uncharacterized protein n=1 Tax=Parascaris univalens TaxID=6257 RepID=A0A915BCT8_PARUN